MKPSDSSYPPAPGCKLRAAELVVAGNVSKVRGTQRWGHDMVRKCMGHANQSLCGNESYAQLDTSRHSPSTSLHLN